MAKDYTTAWNAAREAAQAAGQKWLDNARVRYHVKDGQGNVVGEMLDMCGRAYVETPLNTAFGRWVKKHRDTGGVTKWLHFKLDLEFRQEMGLHVAMANAAKAKLEEYGVERLHIHTWID